MFVLSTSENPFVGSIDMDEQVISNEHALHIDDESIL